MTLLAACATVPARTPYTAADLVVATPLAGPPVRFWVDAPLASYRQWREAMMAEREAAGQDGPVTLLAISGGSDKGAFSAGLLNAWTQRGDRPDFTIVTGVSTGALIAPFAFLGADEDADLTAIYTGIDHHDIYRKRIFAGVMGGPSLLDTKPLQALIARYVTADFLDRIAVQHLRGRRLLVLTTNLDAQRGVIWDLGAIAASRSPKRVALFRQVLLASASIPGAFEPVMIDVSGKGKHFREMHVDGGTVAGFLIAPQAVLTTENQSEASSPEDAIYLMYNGRGAPNFEVVKPRTFAIIGRALATKLDEADRSGIAGAEAFARTRHLPFAVCAIGEDFTVKSQGLFDRAYMRALYDYGVASARSPQTCLRATR